MKTITVTDDMFDKLMNLSKEINSQDHRGTQMPYIFQIQTQEQVSVPEGHGSEAWHYDDGLIETEKEIEDAVFELKGWDEENQDDYDRLKDYEIEEILRVHGWSKVNYDYIDNYENAFFTSKACDNHIRANKHNLKSPVNYLSYAFRNPEMELVMKFLCELSGGKLHK